MIYKVHIGENILRNLNKWKYELMLFGLLQHLFIGIFITDMHFYTKTLWPISMFMLGVFSVGIYIEKGKLNQRIKDGLFILVIVLPFSINQFADFNQFMLLFNVIYALFFAVIFFEVLKFLVKPGYINTDIIAASIAGFFLLIEQSVFLFQFCYYSNPHCFAGLPIGKPVNHFIDFVYYSSITLTTIGYGDITPSANATKLLTALLGIIGQFYFVVLLGIIISKFNQRPIQ